MKSERGYILFESILLILVISIVGMAILNAVHKASKLEDRILVRQDINDIDSNFMEYFYLDKDIEEDLSYENIDISEIFSALKSSYRVEKKIVLDDVIIEIIKTDKNQYLWEINYEIKSNKYSDIKIKNRIYVRS